MLLKKSSCVLYSCVCRLSYVCYHCIGMYPVYICIFLHESEDDYITKHSCSLLPKFFAAATHSLQRESTGEKSNTMDGQRRHSYTMTVRRFPVSVKLSVSKHKKGHFKHVILL